MNPVIQPTQAVNLFIIYDYMTNFGYFLYFDIFEKMLIQFMPNSEFREQYKSNH